MTEQDDKMTTEARKLATEIAPSRDLWPGIEAAIKDQGEASQAGSRGLAQTPWYAQAAAVFLLVGASSLLTYSVMKYNESNYASCTGDGSAGCANQHDVRTSGVR